MAHNYKTEQESQTIFAKDIKSVDDSIRDLNKLCGEIWAGNKYIEYTKAFSDSDEFDRWQENYTKLSNEVKYADLSVQAIAFLTYFWIGSKVIYTFDTDAAEAICQSKLDDALAAPISLLDRIPLRTFALHIPVPIVIGKSIYDHCIIHFELRSSAVPQALTEYCAINLCLIDESGDRIFPSVLRLGHGDGHLDHVLSFQEVLDMNREWRISEGQPADRAEQIMLPIVRLLPYILYLCSQNAEICQPTDNIKLYREDTAFTRHRYKNVKQFMCGEPTGVAIRAFKQEQQIRRNTGHKGSMKRPHMRRGHFHRYWVGKSENRHIEIKWIAPLCVHDDMKELLTLTVPKLKQAYSSCGSEVQ